MKQFVLLLGFMFNIGYLIEAIHLPVSGVSVIYLIIFIILALVGALNNVRIPTAYINFFTFFLFVYTCSFFAFTTTEYGKYKYFMLLLKAPALAMVPFCVNKYYKSFFIGYASALCLLMLLLIAQSGTMLRSTAPDINTRLEVGALNPIWISRLIFELLLIAGLILRFQVKYMLLLLFFLLPVVFMSGSKGPILSCLIACAAYIFTTVKIKAKYIFIVISLIVFVILIIKFTGGLDNNSYFVQRFLRAVPDESSEEMKEMSRVIMWPQTIQKFIQAPLHNILLGYGVGNFNYFYFGKYENVRLYPHNILLEFMVEQGIVFLIFLIFAISYFYRRSKSNFKFIFLYFLMNAMFSGDILLNEQLFIYLSFAVMSNQILNEDYLSNSGKLLNSTYN